MLKDKRIVLGVTGSIAAYKAAELLRLLKKAGATVQVVMSRAACEFVTPLTFQALSGRPVRLDLFDATAEAAMDHIELARWADLIVIAPASADSLARLAQGRADDLLLTLCLAAQCPIAVAPAMNQGMWSNPATQANLFTLRTRGVHILGPDEGEQACGEVGPGRMWEAQRLLQAITDVFPAGVLAGLSVMITAGPTREAIDPVRFLSNRSSGKMGYAMATAAAAAGARVTLVSGPVGLACPAGVECIMVESAEQMQRAVFADIDHQDVFIAAAAVADYKPQAVYQHKLKKGSERTHIDLAPTRDILTEVSALATRPFCVGFAAETDNLKQHALDKLVRKGLDMILANPVGEGRGFEVDENEILALWHDGERVFAPLPKQQLAEHLIALIAERYHAKSTSQNTGSAHQP